MISKYVPGLNAINYYFVCSTELYDQFAVECYEPHMLYGKTLLELSRLEPGVFTNALQGGGAHYFIAELNVLVFQ